MNLCMGSLSAKIWHSVNWSWWVSWQLHRRKWPWLFSCHHTPRGAIQGLSTSIKLSSGPVEATGGFPTLWESSVTISVVLPFRLCSTCLFLKVKLQNESLTFSLFDLLKHWLLESAYGKCTPRFLCFSVSAAAKFQGKLPFWESCCCCPNSCVTWGDVTEKPAPSVDFSVSWSLLLLRENNKQH